MTSERDKMLRGELYDPADSELAAARRRAKALTKAFNDSRAEEVKRRRQLLRELLGACGNRVWIEPPFLCDYGANIQLGSNVFFNYNCVVLDPAPVSIGDNVFIGPAVQIYTANHPLDAATRRTWLETAQPVRIGNDVWIGGGAILCPGVTIGDGAVIGAGSVVTRDIPAQVFAAGNPCRVIRPIEPESSPPQT